jgi:hypothetical protein
MPTLFATFDRRKENTKSSNLSIGKAMSFGEISKSSRSTGQPAARPISVDSISMLSSTLQSLQVGFIFFSITRLNLLTSCRLYVYSVSVR